MLVGAISGIALGGMVAGAASCAGKGKGTTLTAQLAVGVDEDATSSSGAGGRCGRGEGDDPGRVTGRELTILPIHVLELVLGADRMCDGAPFLDADGSAIADVPITLTVAATADLGALLIAPSLRRLATHTPVSPCARFVSRETLPALRERPFAYLVVAAGIRAREVYRERVRG